MTPTYQIIKFEIPMHNSMSIARQIVSHILDDLVVIFMSSAQWFSRFNVFDRGLLSLDATERVAVANIESGLLAVTHEPNSIRVKGMKPCKSLNSGKPASHSNYYLRVRSTSQDIRVTHAFRLSSGESSPKSMSVMILPFTNSITYPWQSASIAQLSRPSTYIK